MPTVSADVSWNYVYQYKVRPGYGSRELLIELLPKKPMKSFWVSLFAVLKEIGTKVGDIHDLWMNNEVLLGCDSDHGPFVISRDIWDCVFVMAPDNQPVIGKIDEALSRNDRFQKADVYYEDYS